MSSTNMKAIATAAILVSLFVLAQRIQNSPDKNWIEKKLEIHLPLSIK